MKRTLRTLSESIFILLICMTHASVILADEKTSHVQQAVGGEGGFSPSQSNSRASGLVKILLKNGENKQITINGTVELSCGNSSGVPDTEAYVCNAKCACVDRYTHRTFDKESYGSTEKKAYEELEYACGLQCASLGYKENERYLEVLENGKFVDAVRSKVCRKNKR